MNLFDRPPPSSGELAELVRLINQVADAHAARGQAALPATGQDESVEMVIRLRHRAQNPIAFWVQATRPRPFADTPLALPAPQPGQPAGFYGPRIIGALSTHAAIACCRATRDACFRLAQAQKALGNWLLLRRADGSTLMTDARLIENEAAHLDGWIDQLMAPVA